MQNSERNGNAIWPAADPQDRPATPAGQSATGRLLTLAVFGACIGALYWAKEILLPFALAVLLSFLLTPVVNRLERLGLGRVFAVVAAVAFAGLLLGCIGWLLAGQAAELGAQLPEYRGTFIKRIHAMASANRLLRGASQALDDVGREFTEPRDSGSDRDAAPAKPASPREPEPAADDDAVGNGAERPDDESSRRPVKRQNATADPSGQTGAGKPVSVRVVSMPASALKQLGEWLGSLVGPLLTAGLVIVLTLFVLVYAKDLRDRLIQLLGPSRLPVTTEALLDAGERVSRYLRMQLLLNGCYGFCVGLGLYLLGLPNSLLWGVLAMVFRFLPYLGPWLAATPPLALSLAVFADWLHPLLAAGLFVALEVAVSNVLEPWFYGSSIGVSPLAIILAAIFWTWLWGPVGLVLAVPLTVCLIVSSRYLPQLHFLNILFSDRPAMALHDRVYQRLLALDDDEAEALANEFLKQATLDELFDKGLVPALRLAEEDHQLGLLSDTQQAFVVHSIRELAEEAGASASAGPHGPDVRHPSGPSPEREATRHRVLCLPVRDEADEAAALMLSRLLRQRGVEVDQGSAVIQAGELLDRVRSQSLTAIVLSIVPPLGHRDGRYLCRRVRAACPELPVIVGLWCGDGLDTARQRLLAAGATQVVSTLREAVDVLNALEQLAAACRPAAGSTARSSAER